MRRRSLEHCSEGSIKTTGVVFSSANIPVWILCGAQGPVPTWPGGASSSVTMNPIEGVSSIVALTGPHRRVHLLEPTSGGDPDCAIHSVAVNVFSFFVVTAALSC